jgi:drug/metabolite transporter (DMT)-like permease
MCELRPAIFADMERREKILAYGAWLAICVLWGTTYLAIRVAVRTLPDAWMTGVRFVIAGSIMLLIFRLRGERFPAARNWIHLAIIGISLIGFGNWLVVWAENYIASGTAALCVAAAPFWIAGVERILQDRIAREGGSIDQLDAYKIAGLIVGFCGVVLLMLPHLVGVWNLHYVAGILAIQLGGIFWAFGSIYSKYKKLPSSPLMNAAVEMLLGGIFMCGLAAVKGDFSRVHWTHETAVAFAYLIIFGSMIGFVSFIYALDKLPSSTVSLYAYINPVIAVWLGSLLLHEEVGWSTIAATIVILIGMWLVRREPRRRNETVTAKTQSTQRVYN